MAFTAFGNVLSSGNKENTNKENTARLSSCRLHGLRLLHRDGRLEDRDFFAQDI